LDPLDLFADAVGGLNPSIIDETTDFPNHAVTVSPATLAAITGNVTLYASRDMRFNSAIALTGAGQGLSASAGRDMQIGAGISTNGGAVSLNAARNMTTFGASPIATAGGNVTLAAQSLSIGNMTVAAGTGVVNAASGAGSLSLGTISSAGGVTLGATGGSVSASNITTSGAVSLSGSSGVSANNVTANGTVTFTGAGFISASNVVTGGGTMTASSSGSGISISSIDTRAGGGPTGAVVSLTSTPSSVSTGNVQAGDANVTMTGPTGVSTSTITTTGNVALTASNGNISSTIDNAAAVTAHATRTTNSNVSVNLSSNTTLNATSVSANTAFCSSTSNCRSATVTLSGTQGVNVGTVSASAAATTNVAAPFNSISESVSISSSSGSINAISNASQVTATNVTLSTNQGSGGGIGTAATALRVNNARNFTFRPNGEFNVLLNGSGPNQLAVQLGVAATGQTYTGTLSKPGAITLNASATDTTVTVSNFAVSSGFDDLVFNSGPSISLAVPNGSLVATSIAVPAGDQVGRTQPTFPFSNVIQGLPVTVSASQDLNVASYTRAAGTQAKASTFTASNGTLSLGNVAAGRDSVNASGSTGVTINSLASVGAVTVSSANGDITVDSLSSSGSNVTLTANNGIIGAASDGPGVEVIAAGTLSVSANKIGATGFTNPLDVAANSVSLTATNGAGTRIGSDATASNPVTAATTNLTVNATGVFNVDTLGTDLANLTVTASPSGVGAGGTAQVTSSGTTYGFGSDGGNFTLANWTAPATQFAGGTLRFNSTAGNITLNNIDFSLSNGNLQIRTNQLVSGNITQVPASLLNLGSGSLTLNADNNVSLADVTAGSMSVSHSNSQVFSPVFSNGACETINFSFVCAPNTVSMGNVTDPTGFGSFSATARHGITAGNLAVGNVSFTSYSGGIASGAIGTALAPAGSVFLNTNTTGIGGSVTTGAIESGSTTIYSDANISVGGGTGTINAANPGAGSVYLYTSNGAIATGAVDANSITMDAYGVGTIATGRLNGSAATTFPGSVNLNADVSVTTGAIDANDISIAGHCCTTRPAIATGAIGSILPGTRVVMDGSTVNIAGALTLDAASSSDLNIASTGNLTIGGNVTIGLGGSQFSPMRLNSGNLLTINGGNGVVSAADGSFLELRAGNTNTATPFQFASISAGPTGGVTVNAPAGIRQTLATGSGGGITAATVTLNADSAGSLIEGPTTLVDPLTVRGTTSLTVTTGGAVAIDRTDGANPIPLLTSVDISQSDATQGFSLTGYSGGQSVAVSYDGSSGAQVAATTSSGAPMSFRYQNSGGANAGITGLGIASKGGSVILDSTNGNVTAGNIDTTDAGSGGQISASAGQALTIDAALDAGSGQVILAGRSIGGSGSITSTYAGSPASTAVRAEATAGDIGSTGTHLAISADSVDLTARRSGVGGDVFASLTGTRIVSLTADNGFTVASDTALTNLAVTTRGDGVGPVTLAAPGQSFGFARNGAAVDITTVSSATPLATLGMSVTNGNLRVVGTGASAIAADGLTLFTSGNLDFDGTGAPVIVTSAGSQEFVATGNLSVTGAATLTAGATQQFRANGDTVFQAQAGSISASAVNHLFVGRDIRLLGGAGTGDAVTVAGTGSQSFSASRHIDLLGGGGDNASVAVSLNGSGSQSFTASGGGNITLAAGTGNASSVTVAASGTGSQTFYADGNIAISGGGTLGANADASVSVTKAGSNTQRLDAGAAISLTGGAGDRGSVTVANSGTGNQEFGDDFCCSNPTDSLTVQGGAGGDSFALVNAAGRQFIKPVVTLGVLGGSGSGAYARINTDATTSSGTSVSGGPQIVGYSNTFDCCSGDVIDTITLAAGGGAGAYAEISSSGSQRIAANTSLTMTGSAAAGAFARIRALAHDVRTGATTLTAGTGNGADATIEAVGTESNRPSSMGFLQIVDPSSLALTAGGTAGANTAVARISSGGSQNVSSSPTSLIAGVGPGSSAEITAVNQQTVSLGNLTMLAGAGDNASARIFTSAVSGSQSLSANTTTLTGGSGQLAKAIIESATSQSVSFGTLTITAGTNRGADASLKAATGQSVNAGNTTVAGGTGTAAGDAMASIVNASGSQSLSTGSLTVRSGADYGRALIATQGSGQTISAGAITVTTSAGANNGGTTFASIEHQGSGGQTITSSSINVNNQHAPGRVGIYAPGDQTVGSSGVVTVQVTGGSGTAEIVAAAGTQTVRGNSASTADAGQAASGGSANGGVRVQVAGGSGGTARIAASAGTQTILGQFVDINTSASGTAAITASGNQWVRTTNGTGSGVGSLRVAAIGGGSATLSSGSHQLLQIDYPELMQAGRDGRITVGNAAATGTSRIVAVNQDVFARSISVLGGAAAGANAKIDVSGIQNVSLVSSSSTPTAGITVTGGAGGTALIDPVTQTILSNGTINVTGGAGPGTVAGIVGTGDQTILVTSGGAGSIAVAGGSGANAFGQITSAGDVQRIGTSGGFTLTGGAGTNADAIIGANGGTAETFLACGSGFTCSAGVAPFTAIPSVNNPFVNGSTDVGVYYSPITVPLDTIVAATGGAPPPDLSFTSPIDGSVLTLQFRYGFLGEGGEEPETRLGRLLPVCR
ncbi:MAG: hypothetical protein JNM90_22860, partial [Burkholderiales bacterium]|nr:hypothetical protein [Burkholderiales bacterium]